ncbi:hypothetical protein Ccrd_004589, partial [Cynara cardunculus var. scolymus]
FSYDLLNNTTFKKQFFKLVWNIHISPDEFESRWMVVRNLKDSTVFCSCNHIGRHGYLCRHVFKVLLNAGVDTIPEEYILRRWR